MAASDLKRGRDPIIHNGRTNQNGMRSVQFKGKVVTKCSPMGLAPFPPADMPTGAPRAEHLHPLQVLHIGVKTSP